MADCCGALGDSFRDLLDGITQGAPGELADLAPAELQLLDLLDLALLGLDGAAPGGFPGAGVPASDFPGSVASLLDFFGQPGDTPLVVSPAGADAVLVSDLPNIDPPVLLLDIDLLDNSLAAVDVLDFELLAPGILRLALLGQELQGLGSLTDGLALLDLATHLLAGVGSGSAPLLDLDALDGTGCRCSPATASISP